ncbi:putative N-acetyltransferase [Pseudomonas reidholzensis]|uniref:Putative N-acetyltransferase n=1 Tax=Pseudomonas reidholzensis TaxID=1785162 RepID=A0A383RZH6_9PSED|nr:GNAT family N-acetyltransferase [Pseudomonas reidholzensis]SYX91851.1 putative N-acetyltransferase [Pseudomonas reidholzensis]
MDRDRVVSIRKGICNDLAAVIGFAHELNSIHHRERPDIFVGVARDADAARDYWLPLLESEQDVVLIAEIDSRPVGFVSAHLATTSNPLIHAIQTCRIGSICVLDGYRGQGIGQALMGAARGWAIGKGAEDLKLAVWAFNTAAIRMYEEFGLEVRTLEMGMRLAPSA